MCIESKYFLSPSLHKVMVHFCFNENHFNENKSQVDPIMLLVLASAHVHLFQLVNFILLSLVIKS